ncbi:MAG: hypothetical protein QM645_05300 [Asticcacaulis sp.]
MISPVSDDTDNLIKLNWSGTVLNVYTVALLLLAPIWAASAIMRGEGGATWLMLILLAGLIALSIIDKPLFTYDPERKVFVASNGAEMPLDQLATIEMDARDIWFIPKNHTQPGWHLSQRCWVLVPRRRLKALAAAHDWPLKDISTPLTRFGFWIAP